MTLQLTPLDGDFSEDAVSRAFAAEGLTAHRWSNSPGDVYASHIHDYHKVLYCLRGSIVFRIAGGGGKYRLAPGDRLDIPPGAAHSAIVGPNGVTCVEAARRS